MTGLDERTIKYAIDVRLLIKSLNKNFYNQDDLSQLLRSSGSVGANYIEANECLSKKDFIYRIKICLKEAKESKYWLRIIKNTHNPESTYEIDRLINESSQLVRIFSSIIIKLK
jgi:four helix bundle protein